MQPCNATLTQPYNKIIMQPWMGKIVLATCKIMMGKIVLGTYLQNYDGQNYNGHLQNYDGQNCAKVGVLRASYKIFFEYEGKI
jgi:hypothetical protein